jgi:RNA polymerase sigma factor (sigma-70 family)
MEVSALKYRGSVGLHGRSPLLRLQSDERLVAFVRRGNQAAFEVLVSRYEGRLLPFCRHMLRSREDAEDVLQEVFAAAFNAILADERPINVRPWLYRIARNRSLNHLRRTQAIGVDSMDVHLSDHGATTADKAHERMEFRMLVGDIQDLPETQRTALLLREMEALSYEQIAEAMETTVPSVKSLLVRARVSLAEAAEARLLTCEEVRIELGELAEGLRRRPSPLVRRHLRGCDRCSTFRVQLKDTNRALAALLPLGPLVVLKKLAFIHLGHSAGAGSSATAAGGGATAAGTSLLAGGGAGGIVSTAVGAVATKAAAGLAAAVIVTAGAVEVRNATTSHPRHHVTSTASVIHASTPVYTAHAAPVTGAPVESPGPAAPPAVKKKPAPKKPAKRKPARLLASTKEPVTTAVTTTPVPATAAGRTTTQTDATVLPATTMTTPAAAMPTSSTPTVTVTSPTTTTPAPPTGTTTTPTVTTTTPAPGTPPPTDTTTTPATTTPAPGTRAPSGTSTTPAPGTNVAPVPGATQGPTAPAPTTP